MSGCHEGGHIFGTVNVDEACQIIIPEKARGIIGIQSGDLLVMLGDEKRGIALVRGDLLCMRIVKVMHRCVEHQTGDSEEGDRSCML